MTINNPKPVKNDGFIDKMYVAYIVGREVSSDGKTPHLQCAMVFKTPKTFNQVRSLFPRAHIEPMRERWKTAAVYCMKDNDYRVYESWKQGGKGGL